MTVFTSSKGILVGMAPGTPLAAQGGAQGPALDAAALEAPAEGLPPAAGEDAFRSDAGEAAAAPVVARDVSAYFAPGRLMARTRPPSDGDGADAVPASKPKAPSKKKGGKRSKKAADEAETLAAATPKPKLELATTEQHFLHYGIHDLQDLEVAFGLLKRLSPRWGQMLADMNDLREQRVAAGETGFMSDQAFPITTSGDGCYATRSGLHPRRTDLAEGIVLAPGASLFAFVHELTHALPLDVLPPELASLPWDEIAPEARASFSEIYHGLLASAYQDESIASLAEVLLYQDLSEAGIPLDDLLQPDELEWLKETHRVFADEGVVGYLQSERYIGRNHRASYNTARLLQVALIATFDPGILAKPGLLSLLQEQGVRVEEGGGVLPHADAVAKLLKDPSPEKAMQLVAALRASGAKVEFDLPTILANLREARELVSGEQQKARASFVGREAEVLPRMAMAAATRRLFENSRTKFEKDPEGMGRDIEDVLTFYEMASDVARTAEASERAELVQLVARIEERIRASLDPAAAELEIARVHRDVEGVRRALKEAVRMGSPYVVDSESQEHGEWKIDNVPRARSFRDPFVRRLFNELQLAFRWPLDENPGDDTDTKLASYQLNASFADVALATASLKGGMGAAFGKGLHELDDNISELFKWMTDVAQIGAVQAGVSFGHRMDVLSFQYRRDIPWAKQASPWAEELKGLKGAEEQMTSIEGEVLLRSLRYQERLREIRLGRGARPSRAEVVSRELVPSFPTLFWLGEGAWMHPEGVPLFRSGGVTDGGPAVEVFAPEYLMPIHLSIEWAEAHAAEAAAKEGWHDMVLQDVVAAFVNATVLLFEHEGLEPDCGAAWVATRLAVRWARFLAQSGDVPRARELLGALADAIEEAKFRMKGGSTALLGQSAQAFGRAEALLPLWSERTADGKRRALDEIADEYAATVRLRRAGVMPAEMAAVLLEFGKERELRGETTRLFELAIEHACTFDISTHAFQNGVQGLLDALHASHLIHAEKDRLLSKLLEGAMPSRAQLAGAAGAAVRRRLEAMQWLDRELISSAGLERVALYPSAEKVLLTRSRELLMELGSAALPPEIEGKVLEVAGRMHRHLLRAHPETMAEASLERLDRVSDDAQYQSDLADVFPSRRVVVDPAIPVEKWSAIPVRRGLLDPVVAWEKIRSTLESSSEEAGARGDTFEAVVAIAKAHALERLEASVRHGDLDKEVSNLFDAYRARQKKMSEGAEASPISDALGIYRAARRVMDRVERVRLQEVAALPPYAWALAVAEKAFGEGRPLSAREERLWEALLSAPTLSDARRLQELSLAIMADERFPVGLRRTAARALASSAGSGGAIGQLIDSFEKSADAEGEARLYRAVAGYWARIGAMPDDMGVLLIEEGTRQDEEGFWRKFDKAFNEQNGEVLDATMIELIALRQGRFAERFLDELGRYVKGESRLDPLLLKHVIGKIVPADAQKRGEMAAAVDEARLRATARKEAAEMSGMGLPGSFLRQPPEVRTLLYLFVKHLPAGQLQSLLAEMRNLDEAGSSAEMFNHFFLRTGLAKAGQFLSTMVGLVPDADRAIYARLQDRVPASSAVEVRKAVEQELGRPLAEVFRRWEDAPIASASMGEVYRAELLDGSEVYVKISPPTKRAQIVQAIETIRKVADAWEARKIALRSAFDIPGQLRAFARQLERQLKFINEMRHAGSFAYDGYATPEFVEDLQTEHMLVMRKVSGKKLTETSDAAERRKSAAAYAAEALRMLLSGEYHADPHPGNAFWNVSSQRLAWLDWGLVDNLREEHREMVVGLLTSLAVRDVEAMVEALEAAGVGGAFDRAMLRQRLGGMAGGKKPAEQLLRLLEAARAAGLFIRPEVMHALAFLLTVNGVVQDLDPDRDFAQDLFKAYLQSRQGPPTP